MSITHKAVYIYVADLKRKHLNKADVLGTRKTPLEDTACPNRPLLTCCRRRCSLGLALLLLAVAIYPLIFCHAAVHKKGTIAHLVTKEWRLKAFYLLEQHFRSLVSREASSTRMRYPITMFQRAIHVTNSCAGNTKPHMATGMAPHNSYWEKRQLY